MVEEIKPMWTARSEEVVDGRGLRYVVEADDSPVPYAQVLHLWEQDADFRVWFLALLAAVPFSAFRWETPPLTVSMIERPFEFVVWDSPGLADLPDPYAFAEYFYGAAGDKAVVSFSNLARDAVLVVPCPDDNTPLDAYGHLAAFVRHAPQSQQHALWEQIAQAMHQRLSTAPVWLSTAGAGVSWLHVRLDDRPKYYGYASYRQTP